MKKTFLLSLLVMPAALLAQQTTGKDAFLRQQAYAEMQRASGRIDVLQTNFDDLQRRVGTLEGRNTDQSLRVEIEALKSAVAELRRELANQRDDIVKELSARFAKMLPKETPSRPAPTREIVVSGPTRTYTVQSGDSLYVIAQAFHTSVAKLREMNGLKGSNLKVGQQLIVPEPKD